MDLRPYHFQYRRPRLSNPTYESMHLYHSIYQLPLNNHPNHNPESSTNHNHNHKDEMSPSFVNEIVLIQLTSIINPWFRFKGGSTYRYNSKGYLQADSRGGRKVNIGIYQSQMANYGSNLLQIVPLAQQGEVFKKQSREFNIISCYPKELRANLKQYPRLTLQDRIIQKNGHVLLNKSRHSQVQLMK